MKPNVSRRNFVRDTAGLGAAASLAGWTRSTDSAELPSTPSPASKIRYCLNTSTIRGQKLPLAEEVQLIAAAGYDAIEPWMGEIEAHRAAGHSLSDLKQQIADLGLTVESAIGFAKWIVDDETERAQGLESLKRDMDLLRQIGGTRIAAPPVGATEQPDLNLRAAAERYARILEVGRSLGVTPQLEVWGFSQSLSRLGEVMQVAIESGSADACLLPDIYHLFKGGTEFASLALVQGSAIQVMHLNDYPGEIPRATIADKDRVYPGDGIAPVPQVIAQLLANGFQGTLSLELFNPSYWARPAAEVLATGLAKMQAAVAASATTAPWR